MPLFVCDGFRCIENTATSNFWIHPYGKKLCSECETGEWHGVFEKKRWDGMSEVFYIGERREEAMLSIAPNMPTVGIRIIEDPLLYHMIPNRKHRKKRINKKWLKRYGYTKKPDENVYKLGGNTIVCHPQIAQKIRESIPKIKGER